MPVFDPSPEDDDEKDFTGQRRNNSCLDISFPSVTPHDSPCNSYIFKKNIPFLYMGYICQHLTWPSLTVEFLSKNASSKSSHSSFHKDDTFSSQKLLFGSHTSNCDVNYVFIGELKFPLQSLTDNILTYENSEGFLSMNKYRPGVNCGFYGYSNANNRSVYSIPCFEIKARLVHPGEVNRAVHMPNNAFFIATKNAHGDGLVYDYSKHPSVCSDVHICKPQIVLYGHECEGYGLAWHPHEPGVLASCCNNGKICVWDINAYVDSKGLNSSTSVNGHVQLNYMNYINYHNINNNGSISNNGSDNNNLSSRYNGSPDNKSTLNCDGEVNSIKNDHGYADIFSSNNITGCTSIWRNVSSVHPLYTWDIKGKSYMHNQNNSGYLDKGIYGLNDIIWHPTHRLILCTACENGCIDLWDLRQKLAPTTACAGTCNKHRIAVNAVSFNTYSEYVLACGNVDGYIYLYDLRNLKCHIMSMIGHTDCVNRVEWNPGCSAVLASCSNDGLVIVWDTSNSANCERKNELVSPCAERISLNKKKCHNGPNLRLVSLKNGDVSGKMVGCAACETDRKDILFIHGGHKGPVYDISWSHHYKTKWLISSVGDDNTLQSWQIAEHILAR